MKPQNSSTHSQAETQPEPEHSILVVRRRLLQALAATGSAVAIAGLVPNQWVKPVVEIGYLPAHAQASGIVLSNGSLSFIPNSSCGGGGGNIYTVSFNYNDSFGGVGPGSQVEYGYQFQPSGSSGQFTHSLTAAEISGDEFQGTISFNVCLAFVNDSQLVTTLQLTDSGGQTSVGLTFTISKPSGALDNGQVSKAMVSPL